VGEIASFFVVIGSRFEQKGFNNARTAINNIAKAGLAMGSALAVAGYKAAQAAGIQERAELTLAQAMQQAGTFAQVAFEHNLEYAKSLQKMTTYGDEAILGVQRMLANFGVEGEMMDKLTKSTLDLAAAKGMDLTAAADLVAKTVGSTTNALTRYGIVVEGDANSTERMQMAVDNVSKIFGGSAQANASTYTGRIDQLKNRFGDLWEKIGFQVIPAIEFMVDLINQDVLPVFEDWIVEVDEAGNAQNHLIKILGRISEVIMGVVDTFKIAGNAVSIMWLAFTGHFKAAKKGFDELQDMIMEMGEDYEAVERRITAAANRERKRRERNFKGSLQNQTAALTQFHENKDEQENTQTETLLEIWLKRLENFNAFTGQMVETITAFYDLKAVRIKNDLQSDIDAENARYDERKKWINENVTDEEERNRQLDELEEGHSATVDNLRKHAEDEERRLKRRMKPFLISEAIANTALGATKALAEGGPFLGPALAAMMTAAGMAKVAIIKAQKFAQGAMALGPTFAMFGEQGPEIALPLNHPNTTEALSEALAKAGGSTSSVVNYITVPPITSRRVASEYGKVIGDEIFRKIKKSRRV